MSCFAIMRGLRDEIDNTPIVDGQFFIETDIISSSDDYNKIHIDDGDVRRELGINSWFGLSKPFESIDNTTLSVTSNALTINNQEWDWLVNKPFETIGSTLFVENGVLKFGYQWNAITDRPFYTVGYGLNVDSNGNLNADVVSVNVSQIGTASSTNTSYQSLTVNNVNNEIVGTKYMEYTQALSTTNNTVYTFNNADIHSNSMIEVYSSIWGIAPKAISVSNGTCTVTFPKYDTNTNLTCRIYILS